jgi:protein O-GlcNAc transferase
MNRNDTRRTAAPVPSAGVAARSAPSGDSRASVNANRLFRKAMSLHHGDRMREAEQLYQGILSEEPCHFGCLYHLGLIRAQQNRLEEAVELFRGAIDQDPTSADALVNLAVAFEVLELPEQALEHAEKAIALRPDRAEAYFAAGNALKALGRLEEAIGRYEKAIALDPRYAEGYYNLGNALSAIERHQQAIEQFDKALAIRPRYPKALNNRGIALQALRRPEEALQDFDKVLAITSNDIDALRNRGNALIALKRHEEGLASFTKVLTLEPDHAEAWHGRGNAFQELRRYSEAVSSFDRALAIKPDHVEALNNRGYALIELKRFVEALASFEQALTIEPGHHALSGAARCSAEMCDWTRTAMLSRRLTARVAAGKPVDTFTFLGYCDDPRLLLQCARQTLLDLVPDTPLASWSKKDSRYDKIRVAYLSADFKMHPTAYLMAELFELHDRSRFEILGVSFGRDDRSDIRARIVKGFDEFHDVQARSDRDVARLLSDRQVDIAVDLSGYSGDCRPRILAHRPAPIQVNYLVFPATTGAQFMDYVIADPIVLPFEQQPFFTEKIVHLPDCYQVNDSKRAISAGTPAREQAALPAKGFVFCCFNKNYKITPPMFDIWMRLLRAVEGSVLWLFRANRAAEGNLQKEAAARGIDPARLVFADRVSLEQHLARHRLADLFLDTLPYNAHTTASDALWAGLPLVTCRGNSFAGRVATSLLHAAGLPELVTNSLEDYEALALRLATEPALLAGLRKRLQQNRLTCPLFDTDRFRRHIEAAYETMWEIRQRGESPRSFTVEPMHDLFRTQSKGT